MVSANSLEPHLKKILKEDGVEAAMVVSRSGMHVAGDAPKNVHMETYVAMSAIVLGASETAASELRESFRLAEIKTSGKKIMLVAVGSRGLLVLTTNTEVHAGDVLDSISKYMKEMKKLLD